MGESVAGRDRRHSRWWGDTVQSKEGRESEQTSQRNRAQIMQVHVGRTAYNFLSSQCALTAKGRAACDHTRTSVNDRVQAGWGAWPSAGKVNGRLWLLLWVGEGPLDNRLRRVKAEAGGRVRRQLQWSRWEMSGWEQVGPVEVGSVWI